MIGVCSVEQYRVAVVFPKTLVELLDAYRATLVPRPSRNFLLMEATVEYLRARGIAVPPLEESEA
jgi:hypothetical protein